MFTQAAFGPQATGSSPLPHGNTFKSASTQIRITMASQSKYVQDINLRAPYNTKIPVLKLQHHTILECLMNQCTKCIPAFRDVAVHEQQNLVHCGSPPHLECRTTEHLLFLYQQNNQVFYFISQNVTQLIKLSTIPCPEKCKLCLCSHKKLNSCRLHRLSITNNTCRTTKTLSNTLSHGKKRELKKN